MKTSHAFSVVVLSALFVFGLTGSAAAATPTVNLGTATSFAVLAGTAITNVPTSTIIGNVGLSPAAGGNYAGLTQAEVTGTIYAVDAAGPAGSVANPGLLTQAKNDLTAAYLDAAGRTPFTTLPGGDNQLGGQTLTDGVYRFGGATTANLSGTLTLDGQGDPNSVFIFQATSSLVTASSSVVSLINGAQPCNVFWQVASSTTLGASSTFVGTAMELTSITVNGGVGTGATINGRVLARNAAVTLDHTTITAPTTCNVVSAAASSGNGSGNDVEIKVNKKAIPSDLAGPGNVTFTYKVTNEGDVPIHDIEVVDNKCSPLVFVSGDSDDDHRLDTQEEWRYTCTRRVSQSETNRVTARGEGNGEDVSDSDTARVVVSAPGFPNAGVGPHDDASAPWNIILPAGFLIAFASFTLTRKKLAQ